MRGCRRFHKKRIAHFRWSIYRCHPWRISNSKHRSGHILIKNLMEYIYLCQIMNSKDLFRVSCVQPCLLHKESFQLRMRQVVRRNLKYSNELYLIGRSDWKHLPIIGSCNSNQIGLTENLNKLPYLLMLITYLHFLLHFKLIMRTS